MAESTVTASVFPPRTGGALLDPRFSQAVLDAEKVLGTRILCFVQHGPVGVETPQNSISQWLIARITSDIRKLPKGQPVTILLHSPGGDAHSAFRLARLLVRHCGSYSVIIPRYAKSAATLLSLGAKNIYFGDCAELGPLDVQIDDLERERQISALEVVQSLERLNSEAMQVMDTMMNLLLVKSGKRIDSLLPHILKYTADITRPIFEKIDTVSFTLHSRLLKIGEDYARSLLYPKYGDEADRIAYSLTRKYPDHGYVIDAEEAASIGLDLAPIPDNIPEPFGYSISSYAKNTVVGFLEESRDAEAKPQKPGQGKVATAATAASPAPRPARGNGSQRRTGDRVGQNGTR